MLVDADEFTFWSRSDQGHLGGGGGRGKKGYNFLRGTVMVGSSTLAKSVTCVQVFHRSPTSPQQVVHSTYFSHFN